MASAEIGAGSGTPMGAEAGATFAALLCDNDWVAAKEEFEATLGLVSFGVLTGAFGANIVCVVVAPVLVEVVFAVVTGAAGSVGALLSVKIGVVAGISLDAICAPPLFEQPVRAITAIDIRASFVAICFISVLFSEQKTYRTARNDIPGRPARGGLDTTQGDMSK